MANVTDQVYLAALGFKDEEAGRLKDSASNMATREKDFAQPLLEENYRRGQRDLDYDQESRGVLRSGETTRKQGEMAYDQQASMADLYLQYDKQMLGIEDTYSRDLMSTSMDRATYTAGQSDREANFAAQQAGRDADAAARAEEAADYQAMMAEWLAEMYPDQNPGGPVARGVGGAVQGAIDTVSGAAQGYGAGPGYS
jgi:hypothetical protein